MKIDNILVRKDGVQIKLTTSLYVGSFAIQWLESVAISNVPKERKKRKFNDIALGINVGIAHLSDKGMLQKRLHKELLKYVTAEEIHTNRMEVWTNLEPKLES